MTSWTPPLFSMIDAMKPAFLASMIFSPEGAAVDLVLLLEPVESRFFFAGKSSSPYVSPQLSLKSNRLFNSKHLGFNSTHQGFNSKHPGFNSKHRGFNSKQWDLNSIRSWNNSGTKNPGSSHLTHIYGLEVGENSGPVTSQMYFVWGLPAEKPK